MSVAQKFRSDAAIYARREKEQKVSALQNELRGDKNLLHKAQWEAKTNNIIQKNIVRNRIADMKRRQESNLEERRSRLAQLLDAEDRMYEQEFMANLETPEQVREKMAQRLAELKQKREQERQDEVNRRLEQRFRDTTDELRKEESKFVTNHVQIEREKQLMEKQRLMHQNIQEEFIYAQLWKLDQQKKEERERKEQEEKKKNIQDTMTVLDWQKDTRYFQKQTEQQKIDAERNMLTSQWKKEEEYEREMERQKFVVNRERNLELIRHNEAEKQLREEQEKREKERDKYMLQNALDREQALERLEQEEKQQRRQEVIDLQKYYLQKAEDKKQEEQLIEYLTWLESEKQWKMKEDKWRKEDQARINLLKDVYMNRAQNIELKKHLKSEQEWLLQNEKQLIDAEIERQNREHEEKMLKDAAYRKQHQGDVLRQIGERDRAQRRELQEKMYEERAAKLAELQYTRKIQEQKTTNANMLATMRGQLSQY